LEFQKNIYLIGGIWAIVQSVMDKVDFNSFGLYFVAMAIFKFGCASGNCAIPYSSYQKQDKH
jgi:hypothetical protein